MLESRIQQHFFEHSELVMQLAHDLSKPIAQASESLVTCITAGGKILFAAIGANIADAQRFATHLCGVFERDRPALPAVVLAPDSAMLSALAIAGSSLDPLRDALLTGICRQLQALASPGDILVLLCGADDLSLWQPIMQVAHEKETNLVVFDNGGSHLSPENPTHNDVFISVPGKQLARISEIHQLAWHCLCSAIDNQLLGEENS